MDFNRRTSIITGLLFITATAAAMVGSALEQPVGASAGYLARTAENVDRLSAGALFEFIAAATSVAIAISMYSVLKRWNAGLALSSVVFRTIEAVGYTIGAVSLLSLTQVGRQYAAAPTADRAWLQAIADSFVALRQEAMLAGVFAFAVGALMYYLIFFRSRLVPRWLSGWGIIAEFAALAACLAALFSHNEITSYAIAMAPIAVQEMVLAVWLIAKGFDRAAIESTSTATASVPIAA